MFEPRNEADTINLFKLFQHKLDWHISHLQTGFPDAIIENRHGEKLVAEFEYRSRNFKYHEHDPSGCDLIICWSNNWIESPVPVWAIEDHLQCEIKILNSVAKKKRNIKKRRINMPWLPRGGEYGTRTPVETRETVIRSRESESRIPVVQSSWAALALMTICASALMFFSSAGPATFWGLTVFVMIVNLVWTIRFGQHLVTEIEQELPDGRVVVETIYGPTGRTWISSALSAIFVGFIGFCVCQFLDLLGLTFPTWFAKPAAVLALFFLVFSTAFFVHIELRFIQDLAYVSFHLEESLAHVLEALGLREVKRPRPAVSAPQPRVIDRGRRIKTNGRETAKQTLGVTDEELNLVPNATDAETMDALEFLVMGQRIKGEDGKPLLYRRRLWKNRKLTTSGRIVTERQARAWAELFAEVGILTNYSDRGFDLTEGLSLGDALESFIVAQGATPPPPDRVAAWARI